MTKFNVYLAGKLIDSVFYNDGFSASEVKQSLVDHDNYNPSIKVVKARNLPTKIYPQKYHDIAKVEAKLKKMSGLNNIRTGNW